MTNSEFVQALDAFLYSYKDWGVGTSFEYEIDGNVLFVHIGVHNLEEDADESFER